jgi:tetratricopeptide (TPR) repeat protein
MLLGAYAEAERTLRESRATAMRMGLDVLAVNAAHNLGPVLARLGRFDEAMDLEAHAVATYRRLNDTKLTGASEHYVALIAKEKGDLATAEQAARRAVEALAAFPPLRPRALATLAASHLLQGNAAQAGAEAREAFEALEAQGQIEDGEAVIRLAHAETLRAAGDDAGARKAIEAARARLREIATKISDPSMKRSFLERVPENARTMELAREWLGEASGD